MLAGPANGRRSPLQEVSADFAPGPNFRSLILVSQPEPFTPQRRVSRRRRETYHDDADASISATPDAVSAGRMGSMSGFDLVRGGTPPAKSPEPAGRS